MSVSVIVRARNESQTIVACVEAVRQQHPVVPEVVLVDNMSEDGTRELVEHLVDRVVSIDEFLPGRALNVGISASSGNFIAMISGHCIPLKTSWLSSLMEPLDDGDVVGVYGRQVPTPDSTARDIRDLVTVFGPEDRIQRRDPMFHNANSLVRREAWAQVPFDESARSIEDRIWAKELQSRGKVIAYASKAVVSHKHGINHDGEPARAERVVAALRESQVYSPYVL